MFNMFKHEDSVIFDPIWCSVIGSDISKSTGAPKKRFLEEYERDLCYRRCAKKLIEDDLIYGVTNANYAKRPDAMKITAVIYQLMYGDKEADYAKLLSLFGKEYASTADVVSGLYRRMTDPTAKLPFKYIKDTWGSDLGNVAVFAIYLLASPESYLPQNRKSFERLSEVFSQINSTRKSTSPMSDQQKVLMKYGISIQKNFSDFETAAMQGSRTRTIPVENEDGTCTQDTIFSYSDYGVHCHSELLSGLAMLDAGVSNCSNYDKTITKQKFLDAQKAVAKSLNFTKELDGKVKFGDMTQEEEQLIDTSLYKVYGRFGITNDNDSIFDLENGGYKKMPLLEDLQKEMQNVPELHRICNILNPLIRGSMACYNRPTNVDLKAKYIVFDFNGMKGPTLTMSMFVVLDFVWTKIKEDRAKRKAVFIDECWKLIGTDSNEMAAEDVVEIFRTIRAYGGSAFAMTQDISQFYEYKGGKYGKAVIGNADTKIIMHLIPSEAKALQAAIQLTDSEMENVSNLGRGQGLVCSGAAKLFVDFIAAPYEKQEITTDAKSFYLQEKALKEKQHKEEQERLAAEKTNSNSDANDDDADLLNVTF